jgi:nucleotide-binding universal stress UspA family protein
MTDGVANDKTGDFGNILCPVDLSDFSKPVIAHAVALSQWYHARVTALHVFASWAPPGSLAAYPGWMMQIPEARESISQELQAIVEPFAAAGVTVPLLTMEGDPAEAIVRCAAETKADLIVMGTHGRSGFDRFTLGSVTEKVLRKASCPVLTLPPGAAAAPQAVEYRQILCPTDFSQCSRDAMRLAMSMALRTRASLTVVHVVEMAEGYDSVSDTEFPDTLRQRKGDEARTLLHGWVPDDPQRAIEVVEVVAFGKPYREILRTAAERHADLIVIGVRGRGRVDLSLFGSTTNQMVRRATCPVITVKYPLT